VEGRNVEHSSRARLTSETGGTARARRPSRLLALAAVVVALAVAVPLAGRALDLLPGLPFGSEEVDRSTPALMTALADLEEYHAATGTYQVVVDLEKGNRWVPSFLKGERTTFLATGSVDGIVDFTGLEAGAVTVSDDRRTVRFSLPPSRLDDADVDLANSRVLDRDRGVVDRVGGLFSENPTSEREVAALAEGKLDDAAAASDLRERTEENTRAMLTSLARSLGFEQVVVEFDAADGL
jgi:hypothetical protein